MYGRTKGAVTQERKRNLKIPDKVASLTNWCQYYRLGLIDTNGHNLAKKGDMEMKHFCVMRSFQWYPL